MLRTYPRLEALYVRVMLYELPGGIVCVRSPPHTFCWSSSAKHEALVAFSQAIRVRREFPLLVIMKGTNHQKEIKIKK
jgi:hypothetical protein